MGDELSAMQRKFGFRTNPTGLANDRRAALFAAGAPARKEQAEQLERVSNQIRGAVIAFWCARIGQQYHADDLRAFVAGECGHKAPASADRVMRDLRDKGAINYELVSKPRSLYRALPLNPQREKGN